jgi:hypothetical protein
MSEKKDSASKFTEKTLNSTELLAQAFKFSQQQCEYLEKTLAGPELQRPEVIVSFGLEFTLKGIASVAKKVIKNPESDEKLLNQAKSFVESHKILRIRRNDINTHFQKIGQGWVCPECKYDIPKYAEIKFLRRPPLEVFLVCKVCNHKTEITKEGYKEFNEMYEDLIGKRWNPKVNGFIWDGS